MSMSSSFWGSVEEARLARSVVRQHELPDFISGFSIEFGEFDGDPALWVKFQLRDEVAPYEKVGAEGQYSERLTQRLDAMDAFDRAVQDSLIRAFPARWPYIDFVSPDIATVAR